MRVRQIVLTGLILALAGAPAAAQGRGKGKAVGRGRNGPAPTVITPSASTSVPVQTLGIRQFGSWLDDASLLPAGQGWAAVSFGHVRALGVRQTDVPVLDGAVGLTGRAQVGTTVPYYRLHFIEGGSLRGFGDVYLNAKLSILDPASKGAIGLALTPLIEVLSDADPVTGSRVFWGLPVSVEYRAPRYRAYGSGGYFSRGAVFASGALEVPVTDRLIATAALMQMRSLNDDAGADALGLSRNRIDVAGSASYILTPAIAAFGSIGRTIGGTDGTGASLMLNGGVSITFVGRATP